jgi:hypothetical protein
MVDRILALIALAITVVAVIAPYRWPKMQRWVTDLGLGIGCLLLGFSICFLYIEFGGDNEPEIIRTNMRIQFYGDERIPTEVYSENISNWYAVWSPSAIIRTLDANGKEVGYQIFPKTWSIFVLFERPVKYRQLIVLFSSSGFPSYEVKQQTQRFAIIAVSGNIPNGALEVYTQP